VLQRMVGGKLLRGKKGFGGGGRDDDDDPRPKFARSFPSFFLSKSVRHCPPDKPSTSRNSSKSHYYPPDGDHLPPGTPEVPLSSTRRRPSSSESPGNAHRTDGPSSSRKSRYCPPDGDPLPPAGTAPKSRLLGTVQGTSPKQ
jgi:hypothetical protein